MTVLEVRADCLIGHKRCGERGKGWRRRVGRVTLGVGVGGQDEQKKKIKFYVTEGNIMYLTDGC
jgi:hypothetical protein